MHVHALIHIWSVNTELPLDLQEEKGDLLTDGPFGAPRKGELKGEALKYTGGRSDEANRPSRTMFP